MDDPNTHLELTMIHEAMILDHGGVELAYILYGAAMKFWLLGTLLVGIIFKVSAISWAWDCGIFILGLIALALIVGIVESVLARLRLMKVPHFLIVALALAVLALAFTMR